jgi:EAL domain-containing protein (putative c-di-GMP-specific phosphodiesterase class I)
MIFIPIAEKFSLISKIDKIVIEKTLAILDLYKEIKIYVNVSAKSLNDDIFIHSIINILASNPNSKRLGIEITESHMINQVSKLKKVLQEFKNYVLSISIDDFGVGFASFSYLLEFPVDHLKIDGLFVKNIFKDPWNKSVIVAINNLAHALGKKTVAEFVEDDDILNELKIIGIDYYQGFGIGKPKDVSEYLDKTESFLKEEKPMEDII